MRSKKEVHVHITIRCDTCNSCSVQSTKVTGTRSMVDETPTASLAKVKWQDMDETVVLKSMVSEEDLLKKKKSMVPNFLVKKKSEAKLKGKEEETEGVFDVDTTEVRNTIDSMTDVIENLERQIELNEIEREIISQDTQIVTVDEKDEEEKLQSVDEVVSELVKNPLKPEVYSRLKKHISDTFIIKHNRRFDSKTPDNIPLYKRCLLLPIFETSCKNFDVKIFPSH